ncbi:MAG: recombination mediator RecR [Planctomycetota bacterium]|jgi:recombination protein RecR|nr:recombination mediator RecR [Planctomycetota bacterium]
MAYPPAVTRLIEAFRTLPGVGTRTAERLTFHLLRAPTGQVQELTEALEALAASVVACEVCHNLADRSPCSVCTDSSRDGTRVLVVEQPRDVPAFEDAGWSGRYHVLLGHVNPLEGIEASDLTIESLLERVEEGEVKEVILATNPDYEGDATALHVRRSLDSTDVTVSRIARGVASGSAIEYSNAAMLSDALSGRSSMDSPS